MNPGTLNHARILEHRIQHLTERPKHMLDHWFQLTQTWIFVLATMQPIQIPNRRPCARHASEIVDSTWVAFTLQLVFYALIRPNMF